MMESTTFEIGQKVVYIHHKINDTRYGQITPEPAAIYTVRAVDCILGVTGILLDEIRNEPRRWAHGVHELLMNASYFRPLVQDKSEIIFTAGADPSSDKWDNRFRQKVRA